MPVQIHARSGDARRLGRARAGVAAVVILATGWTPIDSLLSMLVALLIARSAAALLLESSRALRADLGDAARIRAWAEPPP